MTTEQMEEAIIRIDKNVAQLVDHEITRDKGIKDIVEDIEGPRGQAVQARGLRYERRIPQKDNICCYCCTGWIHRMVCQCNEADIRVA